MGIFLTNTTLKLGCSNSISLISSLKYNMIVLIILVTYNPPKPLLKVWKIIYIISLNSLFNYFLETLIPL